MADLVFKQHMNNVCSIFGAPMRNLDSTQMPALHPGHKADVE